MGRERKIIFNGKTEKLVWSSTDSFNKFKWLVAKELKVPIDRQFVFENEDGEVTKNLEDGDIVRIKLKGIRTAKKESRRMRSVVNKIDEKRDNKLEITGLDNLIRLIREIKN